MPILDQTDRLLPYARVFTFTAPSVAELLRDVAAWLDERDTAPHTCVLGINLELNVVELNVVEGWTAIVSIDDAGLGEAS